MSLGRRSWCIIDPSESETDGAVIYRTTVGGSQSVAARGGLLITRGATSFSVWKPVYITPLSPWQGAPGGRWQASVPCSSARAFPGKRFSQQSHKSPLQVSNINMLQQQDGLKFQVTLKRLNRSSGRSGRRRIKTEKPFDSGTPV